MSQAVDPKPPAGAITAVLVFAEAGDSGRALVAAAGALARDFDARLIGLGAQALHPMPASSPYGGVTTAHWVAEMTAQLETELAEAETTFAAAAQRLAGSSPVECVHEDAAAIRQRLRQTRAEH